jgi:hypothetical protein
MNKHRAQILLLFIVAIILATGGVFLILRGSNITEDNASILTAFTGNFFTTQTSPTGDEEQTIEHENTQPIPPIEKSGRYYHPLLEFSFNKPSGYLVNKNQLWENTEILVVENTAAGSSEGFQIFVTPHDEPSVNIERIRIDLPELVMRNIQTGSLDSVDVLIFNSFDESLGDTYEIWFVHNQHLYQIMTYANFESELNTILASWQF